MSPGGRPKVIASQCATSGCPNPGRSRFPRPTRKSPNPPTYCARCLQALSREGALECSWPGCRRLRQWNKLVTKARGFCREDERKYVLSRPDRLAVVLRDSSRSIDFDQGCWVWRIPLERQAKGDRPRLNFGYSWLAYRFFYVLVSGPLAAPQTLDHLCGRRACVAPHHMEPVSEQRNKRRQRERLRGDRSRARDIELNTAAFLEDEGTHKALVDLVFQLFPVRSPADAVALLERYTPHSLDFRSDAVVRLALHDRDDV